MKECYICGKELIVIRNEPYEYIEDGIHVLIHGLTQYRCEECGETFTPIPTPIKLNEFIGQTICKENKGLLLPSEIKFLRKTMGLKAKELASMMGVDPSTVSRWENGAKEIGESNDRLLRTIFSLFAKQEDGSAVLESLRDLPRPRKEVKEPRVLSINPPEWLLSAAV